MADPVVTAKLPAEEFLAEALLIFRLRRRAMQQMKWWITRHAPEECRAILQRFVDAVRSPDVRVPSKDEIHAIFVSPRELAVMGGSKKEYFTVAILIVAQDHPECFPPKAGAG